jgi:hypothetical protein
MRDYSKSVPDAQIQKTKEALEANGFIVEVVDTLDQARDRVLSLVPEGSEVFTGTSETLEQAGLAETFNESGKYNSVRKQYTPLFGQPDRAVEMRRIGSGSEYTVGSVHGLTEDGQVVIASKTGSQLPNYAYGAQHVVWVVGSQKIVKDLPEALERLENYTLGLEHERSLKAYGQGSAIHKILIYRQEDKQRVTIVIVREAVGY